MLFSSLGPAVGAVKSGKIRPIAVTSLARSAAFPIERIKADSEKWARVVKEANIRAE
jgi:hypothetical protein